MATTFLTKQDAVGTNIKAVLQQGSYSDTEVLRRLHERTQVVCRIVLETGQSGTGFLIGKDLIMTNHHVLESKETAYKAKAVFFYTNPHQEGVTVDIDPDQFFCTSPTPDRLGFKPITKIKLDFTIVSIKSHPKITNISHLAFSIFNSPELKIGNYANIIHHPVENNGSSTQKVSFRDNVVKESTLFTLHYTTYTMPGSSGAPVMDDEGNLIALHRAACRELLQALLNEDVLKAFLKQLFPKAAFSQGTIVFKDSQWVGRQFQGLCATIDDCLLYIFPKGELKGTYYHQNKMKSPASLFELIQTQHNPPKAWALEFLKQQDNPVLEYHQECNTAVRISAIYQHLQDIKRLDQIKERYEATQKNLYTLLKESYLRHLAFLPLILTNAEFPIESFFTQLSIVSSASQEKKEEEARSRNLHLLEKDSLREIYARLHHPDESLEIDALFNNRNDKPVTKVLVLGKAGIGKSTLCQKITYDWALGILFKEKFAVVYHLKLRVLNVWIEENNFKNFQDSDEWLSNAISEFCYQGTHQKKIFQELQDHPDKILVIFDGWDEASPAVIEVIKQYFLKTRVKHYLLTSRPGVTASIHGNFDLIVENMGFTDKQIEVYTEKFFTHTKSSELKTFLSNLRLHNDLFTIAHIPIQLQILCALWQKGEKEFPQTLTLMFSKITSRLFDWEQSKQAGGKELPRSQKQLLYQALGKIALKGLDNKQLILPKTLIDAALEDKKFDTISSKDLIGTGLIKGCGENGEMYFIHLTYQEYTIAESISNLPTEEQRAFVQTYRYKPHFHLVICMLAGSIWEKTHQNFDTLKMFFEWLYSDPVNQSSEEMLKLGFGCLNECIGGFKELPPFDQYLAQNILIFEKVAQSNDFYKHTYTLKYLYTKHSSLISQADKKGILPFLGVCVAGNLELAIWLLEKDPLLIGKFTQEGATPLYAAAAKGHLPMAQWLHEKDPSLLGKFTQDGWTPLHAAAVEGRLPMAQWLHEKDPSLLGKFTQDGWTPLHSAAVKGHLPMAQWLLEKDPSLLGKFTQDGWTPLHIAAAKGHLPMTQWLLEKDPSLLDKFTREGWTPLHSAAAGGHLPMTQWLHEKDPSLLGKFTQEGWTPLHAAAQEGHLPMVQWLCLQDSRQPFLRWNGETPFKIATRYHQAEVAEWLQIHFPKGCEENMSEKTKEKIPKAPNQEKKDTCSLS